MSPARRLIVMKKRLSRLERSVLSIQQAVERVECKLDLLLDALAEDAEEEAQEPMTDLDGNVVQSYSDGGGTL